MNPFMLPFRVSTLAVGIWIALVIIVAIVATESAATRDSRITAKRSPTFDTPTRLYDDHAHEHPRRRETTQGCPVLP
jgi:hypothetical protein